MPPPRHPNPVLGFLRRRGWKLIIGVLLLVLGLSNVYPFIWMLGTSLKSTSESSAHRAEPIPRVKYRLTVAGEAFVKDHLTGLTSRQLVGLAKMRNDYDAAVLAQPGTPRPLPETDATRYGREASAPADAAPLELEALAERELLIRLGPIEPSAPAEEAAAPAASADAATYQLAPAVARAGEGDDVNVRQWLVLRFAADKDEEQRNIAGTFVPFGVTADEAAEQTGLSSLIGNATGLSESDADAWAARELQELETLGLVDATRFQWINYWVVFKDMRFYLKVLTSIILVGGVVTVTLTITSMLGYALARLSFPGKIWVLMLLLVGAVAPREAVIIPIFRMLQGLGLLDMLWGMVLWLGAVGVGNALLMAGFFLTLPKEVEEAAAIDGAGPFRTFFDIALPMAQPIVMTIGLFAFLSAWNDFLIPFLCTQASPNMQPLAVAVYSMQQEAQGYWHLMNAAAAIMILPVIALFLLLQRYIVRAIAVGAVKG